MVAGRRDRHAKQTLTAWRQLVLCVLFVLQFDCLLVDTALSSGVDFGREVESGVS